MGRFTGALFVCCMDTRAIHLEVVIDLTEETFLLAFRRFFAEVSIKIDDI